MKLSPETWKLPLSLLYLLAVPPKPQNVSFSSPVLIRECNALLFDPVHAENQPQGTESKQSAQNQGRVIALTPVKEKPEHHRKDGMGNCRSQCGRGIEILIAGRPEDIPREHRNRYYG